MILIDRIDASDVERQSKKFENGSLFIYPFIFDEERRLHAFTHVLLDYARNHVEYEVPQYNSRCATMKRGSTKSNRMKNRAGTMQIRTLRGLRGCKLCILTSRYPVESVASQARLGRVETHGSRIGSDIDVSHALLPTHLHMRSIQSTNRRSLLSCGPFSGWNRYEGMKDITEFTG